MTNTITPHQQYHSLNVVRQEIHSLSVQLEKGFIDLSGVPAKSSDGFKDTLDTCTRLLSQGAKVLCIGENGVGKSSLINYMLQSRMQAAAEYEHINQVYSGKLLSEVFILFFLNHTSPSHELVFIQLYKGFGAPTQTNTQW